MYHRLLKSSACNLFRYDGSKFRNVYRTEGHNTKLAADSWEIKLIRLRVSEYFEKFQNADNILQIV